MIDRQSFPSADKKLIRDFIEHCQAQGVSFGRLYKLTWTLLGLKRRLPVSFRNATRKDIERLVGGINGTDKWSANTKSDTKKILKRSYKYVRYGNADKLTAFPPEVAWINTEIKRNEQTEPEVLTEEETKRLVEAATSTTRPPRNITLQSLASRSNPFPRRGTRFLAEGQPGST